MKLFSYLALGLTLQAEAKKKKGASGKRKRNSAPALCNKIEFANGLPTNLGNNLYNGAPITNNFSEGQVLLRGEEERVVFKKRDCICANGFKKKKVKMPNPEDGKPLYSCDRPNISGVLKAKQLADETNENNTCFEEVRVQLNSIFSDDPNAREIPKLSKEAKTFTFDQAKETLNNNDLSIPLNCKGYGIQKLHLVKKSTGQATPKFIVPYVVTDLDLSDNHIDNIHKDANPFHSLPWLKTANFKNNYLKEVPTGIFKASEMLEEVDFSFNQLSTLSHANTFKKNTAMTKLSLNNNMIHNIQKKSIMKLENLQELYLNNNRLSLMKSKLLSKQKNLNILDLSHNNIHKVSSTAFSQMSVLKLVKLNNNKIAYLTKKVFEKNVLLEEIDLSYNQLGYTDARGINGADLQKKKLIHKDAFAKNINCKKLLLNNNYIKDLKPETFLNMKSLVEVNLDHNNIVDIDANLFAGNPELKFVFMRYNGIKTVPAFDSNTQLKIAYLSHNMIESLNLSNLEHLKRVDVGDNTFTELNDNALSGSTGNLEFMYANAKYGSQSHQKLNQVGDHVLDGAAKLKVVDFADNSLNESQIKFVPQGTCFKI